MDSEAVFKEADVQIHEKDSSKFQPIWRLCHRLLSELARSEPILQNQIWYISWVRTEKVTELPWGSGDLILKIRSYS